MKQNGTVLVVDDNKDILIASKLLLKKHFHEIKTTDTPFDIETIINEHTVDVVLLDMNFDRDSISGREGFYWLKKILTQAPNMTVVLMTAYGDIQLAVEAIKQGAADFISKPWPNDELLACVTAAMGRAKDKMQVSQLKRQAKGLNHAFNASKFEFLGESDAMAAVFETIEKVAKTDANILITGESGTGKEMTAHAIHQQSHRLDGPFVSLDMGALSPALFESELFGHKKGAFTDAKDDRVGRFELAEGGSLFLDELGNLPLEQQVKLLAALQNRKVTPIGATKPIDVDIRLISATNNNLHTAVAQGQFRQDLLYRINTVEIRLPPLRERKSDIPLLVGYYLTYFSNKYDRQVQLSPSQLKALIDYPWPGNIRELAHTIERALILSSGNELDLSSVLTSTAQLSEHYGLDTDTTRDYYTNNAHTSDGHNTDNADPTFDLEVIEHRTIRAALKHFQGNISHAAKALGLTRGALYRRLEKYGL